MPCSASFIDEGVLCRNRAVTDTRGEPLRMPLLLLWADNDVALSPNLLTNIGSLAPNADVRLLPNCSHWIQQDAPQEVNALLREFVERDA